MRHPRLNRVNLARTSPRSLVLKLGKSTPRFCDVTPKVGRGKRPASHQTKSVTANKRQTEGGVSRAPTPLSPYRSHTVRLLRPRVVEFQMVIRRTDQW